MLNAVSAFYPSASIVDMALVFLAGSRIAIALLAIFLLWNYYRASSTISPAKKGAITG
jgi:hypothetical protein